MNAPKRIVFFIGFFYFLLFCLIARAFYMQVLQYGFYQEKSKSQLVKTITIYPHRGLIFDRNRVPLAITENTYSAYVFPAQLKDKAQFSEQVAPIFSIPSDQIYRKITAGIPFVWIKRKMGEATYQELKKLHIHGMEFIKEERRVYPYHNLASHVLGFVGIDNQGLGGLEYLFDSFLKGSPGKIVLESDPRGFRVASGYKKTLNTAYDGGHIVTTLDSYLQYVTECHLKNGVQENGGAFGIAIVMDPTNGDILALANYPDFDPNQWTHSETIQRKDRAVCDVYEPGSVFKIVTLSSVIDQHLVEPNTVMYVPETLEVGTRRVKEAHPRSPGETDRRTVSEILEKSLNVGTTLLAKQLGEKRFYEWIKKFGFGRKTGIELPGEPSGLVRSPKIWSAADIAMFSFGQGIGVTPIQMVTAGSCIANNGVLIKPRIVQMISYNKNMSIKGIPKTELGQIISKQSAEKVREMLIQTVEKGTGVIAKIPGFTIAGKTGTAQKPAPGGLGYMAGQYVASFLGFFPANAPKYVILVIVDSPQKSIYGSAVAAPIFRNIALDIIDYKRLQPDKPVTGNILINYQSHP